MAVHAQGPLLKPDLSGLRKESHRHRLPFDRRGFFEPFVFATAALPLHVVNTNLVHQRYLRKSNHATNGPQTRLGCFEEWPLAYHEGL